MHGLESFISLLKQFFPPDFSLGYLRALSVPVLETLEIAAGAMLFALSIVLLRALLMGGGVPASGFLYVLLVSLCSIRDLTMAILWVVIFGIGPGAGMLAIAIYYGAAMGKVGGDLFVPADPQPVEALRATGATRFTVPFYGLLPLRFTDLLTLAPYDFYSALHTSIFL